MNFYSIKGRLTAMFAIFFILGLIFTITGSVENYAAENADMDFNYMDDYEFKDGMYVKGRIYEIYGEFAVEETQNKRFGITTSTRISSHYYVVPMTGTFDTDTPKYIAVEISHIGMIEEAEKLMNQTWNYYDYGIEPDIWNEFDIKGKVSPLKGELLDYFYEWLMYGDTTATRADYEKYICPYIITYRNTSSSTVVFTVILAAIGAIGLTVMIMLHIRKNDTKNTYNQLAYTDQNTVPPYSPDAYGMPQPVKHNGPDIDDFFNNGEKCRIPGSNTRTMENTSISVSESSANDE